MTMHKELRVNFGELSHLLIPCGKCQTRVLLDCNDQEARIPDECPGCGEEYGSSFRETLQVYRQIYRKLADAKDRGVQVRISAETP